MTGLGFILAMVTVPSVVVFFVAYRRVHAALDAGAGISEAVPVATVVAGGPRFTEGRALQRVARVVPAVQAGLVSFAVASIAFMLLTVVAMVGIALTH